MIPLSVPSLKGNELKYVTECIETEWVSSAGPFVTRFERDVARYLEIPSAVACINGTAALHTALLLTGVGPEDEVVVPTLTFIAPVNAVRYVGAHPVFMDCDDWLNLDAEKLAEFLARECEPGDRGLVNRASGRRVAAVLVVHVFGHPARLAPLLGLARQFRLPLIEDATEALGSTYEGWDGARRYAGTLGDVGCLSFNGNKLVTTGGGGMLLTRDAAVAERARYLTTQAKDDGERFVHHEVGYNYRLTNVQAAIGCAQLERVEEFIRIKRENFAAYRRCLADVPGLRLIEEPPGTRSNYWHYTLVVDEDRYGQSADTLRRRLAERAIETRPIWELNHRQRPYRDCHAYRIEKAVRYHARSVNLPCSVGLDPELVPEVARVIRERA
ncbi:MAG: aminotransferase DegT [Elusimicrobia bacterium GWA2_69_24]|nr:MAG: aminotransferase DegT [Candidatus Rokubacteria bacterium RBG_16_73_20]OGR60880.1 MAG: aminotransferase DegT [Elusimicrobia bacterium GWA2_69_24]HBH00779.1 LegC family aminotransferase [Candidatus Rokubacteria bacterium]